MKQVTSILELIGHTPIKQLGPVLDGTDAHIWVKLEHLNPSGSLKDRIALEMIEEAERKGDLKRGDTIIESSSGNTAIALSFVGGVKGYRRIIFMPETVYATLMSYRSSRSRCSLSMVLKASFSMVRWMMLSSSGLT